jgi:hypothetical protein
MVSVLVWKAVDRGFIGCGLACLSHHYATDEPTIYRFRDKHANHYATDEPTIYHFRYQNANHYVTDEFTIYRFRDENANPPPMNPRYAAFETSTIGGVMVSVLVSKAVDRGFIGGIMVNVLVSKVVDRGFIDGISMLTRHQLTHNLPLSRQER